MKHRVMWCVMIALLAIGAYSAKSPPVIGSGVVLAAPALYMDDVMPTQASPPAMTQVAFYIQNEAISVDDVARTGFRAMQTAMDDGTRAMGGALNFTDEVMTANSHHYRAADFASNMPTRDQLRC